MFSRVFGTVSTETFYRRVVYEFALGRNRILSQNVKSPMPQLIVVSFYTNELEPNGLIERANAAHRDTITDINIIISQRKN